MYSYLLFSAPPSEATKPLYLAIIRSSLQMIETDSRELTVFRPAQLNLYSIPVDGKPPVTQADATLPEWALEHYFYPRAQKILAMLRADRAGPYILSTITRAPQTAQALLAPPYLLQDLTNVEPTVAPAWIGYFLRQSMKNDPWQESMGAKFALELRTYIESVALQTNTTVPAMFTVVKWIDGKQ
jgi:hypothetical protein